MNDMGRFRQAVVQWAAGGAGAAEAGTSAREAAAGAGLRTVVLVEGGSDQVAVEALAARLGRDLDEEGVSVVPLGGAMSVGRFVDLCGPQGLDVRLAGLCDVAEERFFRRALERAGIGSGLTADGLESLGFFLCHADLEDEFIRSLGADVIQQVVEEQGELRAFRTLQNQPAQRGWTVEQHLHRFMGTHAGRKAQYAQELVASLDLDRTPPPLERLLAHV